jgi:hypothetical protein
VTDSAGPELPSIYDGLAEAFEVIVHEDDAEVLEQELNVEKDKIKDQMTAYSSTITTVATGKPENVAEISARGVNS